MKKYIFIFIAVVAVFVTSACSLEKCDFCGATGADNTMSTETSTRQLCDDCLYEFEDSQREDYYEMRRKEIEAKLEQGRAEFEASRD